MFGRRSLSYILNIRIYIGEINRGGRVYKGRYRLLIDPSLFDQCQDILKGKNRRTGNPEILFSGGMFRCAHCGSAMVGEQIRRKLRGGGYNVHVYYKCTNNDPDPDHPAIRWKEDEIEELIVKQLDEFKLPEKARSWFYDTIGAVTMNINTFKADQRKTLRKRKTELTGMQDKLLNSYLAAVITEDVFTAKSEQLKSELTALEKRQDEIENGEMFKGLELQKVFDFTQKIGNFYCGSSFSKKRELLELVTSNRHLSNVSLCLEKTKPFDFFGKLANLGERVGNWQKLEPDETIVREFVEEASKLPRHRILSICNMLSSFNTLSSQVP